MHNTLTTQVKSFFGVKTLPFTKRIPPEQIFRCQGFSEAMKLLYYLDDRRGIGAVIGPSGCGKSTLIRSFLHELPRTTHACAYIAHGSGTITDLYREICWSFDLTPGARKSDMAKAIKERIQTLSVTRKIRPVLLIDEGHLLPAAFLEEMRFLMNYQEDGADEMTLLLIGQPQMVNMLRLAVNEAIAQRIFVKIRLRSLSRAEVGPYLNHRLQIAGRSAELFLPDAVEAIAKASHGIPRLINSVAEHAMLLAVHQKTTSIDADIITRTVEEGCL